MLRLIVLLLIFSNIAYFAWGSHWFADWGFAPAKLTEPERLSRQIKPEAIALLSPTQAQRLDTNAPIPQCFRSGLIEPAQEAAVRQALAGQAPELWRLEAAQEGGRWIVYMGKYPNLQTLSTKKAELRRLSVAFEALQNPTLEPGVALGRFESQELAQERLSELSNQGVRTARVVQETGDKTGLRLHLPALPPDDAELLQNIKAALGKAGLKPCSA